MDTISSNLFKQNPSQQGRCILDTLGGETFTLMRLDNPSLNLWPQLWEKEVQKRAVAGGLPA